MGRRNHNVVGNLANDVQLLDRYLGTGGREGGMERRRVTAIGTEATAVVSHSFSKERIQPRLTLSLHTAKHDPNTKSKKIVLKNEGCTSKPSKLMIPPQRDAGRNTLPGRATYKKT